MSNYASISENDSGRTESKPQRDRVPVAGGVLVYEERALGKELIGFESVTDWDALADAVAAKGHDRGDALHLPELDA